MCAEPMPPCCSCNFRNHEVIPRTQWTKARLLRLMRLRSRPRGLCTSFKDSSDAFPKHIHVVFSDLTFSIVFKHGPLTCGETRRRTKSCHLWCVHDSPPFIILGAKVLAWWSNCHVSCSQCPRHHWLGALLRAQVYEQPAKPWFVYLQEKVMTVISRMGNAGNCFFIIFLVNFHNQRSSADHLTTFGTLRSPPKNWAVIEGKHLQSVSSYNSNA